MKVWNVSEFLWSQEEQRISWRVSNYVSLMVNGVFPKWVKAIQNYCMYTGDRVERLLMKWYSKQTVARMSDYFHPMVYRIINTMYWYLLDKNFSITAHWGRDCWQDAKVQKNAEWFWRQRHVWKNMMRIIKQAVLIWQCWGAPYVEHIFHAPTVGKDWKVQTKKKEYIEDYITAWLYKVSPFHLFYDPAIDREEQNEVMNCRFASWDDIMKELRFIQYDNWTKIPSKMKVNFFTMKEQEEVKSSWAKFCQYDFSRVRQVWRQRSNASAQAQIFDCLNAWNYNLQTDLANFKIEKNNEIHERFFVFRKVDCERHLSVFINKKMIFSWPSPYWNQLPYAPIYYKEPMEGSIERGLGILLEQPQEVVNNAYRAKHDTIRTNNINGSVKVVSWVWTVKKNGKAIDWDLQLSKDDTIYIPEWMKITNFPVANLNQNDESTIIDANWLWDYISNLSNVTGWQSRKISRVSWEVIAKTQITEREIEPIVMSIEDFVTRTTEYIMTQIIQIVPKKYKVFIAWEDVDININDLKWRYTWTRSTSRIDQLYREFNAQKKDAALQLMMQVAPELVNRSQRLKEIACLWWIDESIAMTESDAQKVRIKQAQDEIDMEIKLLEKQKELQDKRNEIFPPAAPVEERWITRTNINVNYKDITNPIVKQEILAELWAESSLNIDPATLLSYDNKSSLEKPVWFVETTDWVWEPWTRWVLVDDGADLNWSTWNLPEIFDLAENT